MQRVRPARSIPVTAALFLGMGFACVVALAVLAADPTATPPIQGTIAVPAGSVVAPAIPSPNPNATAPAASTASGTAVSAPSPVSATVAVPSAVVPPEIPPIATSSGPDSGQVIETLIGVTIAVVIVAVAGWGLIRLIASAGR
ncbi:MAG: hypothetical protein ACYDAR_14485 [Thermomicrobiales bacterium]